MQNVRELRLLVDLDGDVRSICKLAFSNRDASLYLFPYAPSGRYYYGDRSMKDVEFEDTFRFTDDNFSERVPKLSIHESGQVHIKSSGITAGPLYIEPLSEWRGKHFASVSVDEFDILDKFEGSISKTGAKLDIVIPTPNVIKSGRFVFYLAGDRPAFVEPDCSFVISMMRETINRPIFIGIQPKAQEPIGEPKGQGIIVLAGWRQSHDQGTDYLYIRGI